VIRDTNEIINATLYKMEFMKVDDQYTAKNNDEDVISIDSDNHYRVYQIN